MITVNEDLINSSQMVDAAADICSTSNVSFESVSPVVCLSKYDLGSLISLENILTLKSKITLLEIQELALVDVNANKELKAITEKRITE